MGGFKDLSPSSTNLVEAEVEAELCKIHVQENYFSAFQTPYLGPFHHHRQLLQPPHVLFLTWTMQRQKIQRKNKFLRSFAFR